MIKKGPFLFVISAPSGAGKTTLCLKLLKDFPDITLSISSTTRAPRGSEQHAKEYFFLSHDEFEKQIKNNAFAEHALVHGNYYGTSKAVIQAAFSQNKSVLLDIDVQGAEQLRKSFPEQCARIFISPPSLAELEFRLRARGTDSEANIQKRLTNAKDEMTEGKNFDFLIINDSIERAYGELKSLLETHFGMNSRREEDV